MRGMSISRLLAAALPLAALWAAAPLRADEAYVCDGGRIVYVRFGEIEAMKRKDPCVAAYYGRAIEPAAVEPAAEAVPLRASQAAHEAPPVAPPLGPAGVVLIAGDNTRTAGAPVLKSAPRLVSKPRPVVSSRVAASGTVGRVVERAPAALPTAHPDTDFRNVRLINAQPGQSEIYQHLR